VRNRCLSKSISDAGWGLLRNALTYMAERSLGVTAFVNPANTSQLCSGCGAYVRKDLSVRVHCCPECGLTVDRDVNAACNVLKRGFGLGLGQADFMPVGGVAAARLGGVGQVVSVIQEAHLL
jgi:transposase